MFNTESYWQYYSQFRQKKRLGAYIYGTHITKIKYKTNSTREHTNYFHVFDQFDVCTGA